MIAVPLPPAAPADVLVYTPEELAETLRVSRKTVHRMDQSGRLPRPIRIAGRLRWRRDELAAWLAAGAPSRRDWERMRPT